MKPPTIPSKNHLDLIALPMMSRALKTTGTSSPQFQHVGDEEEEESVESDTFYACKQDPVHAYEKQTPIYDEEESTDSVNACEK
jgi:hypothetical protein